MRSHWSLHALHVIHIDPIGLRVGLGVSSPHMPPRGMRRVVSSHGLSETCDAVDLDIANVASQLVVTSGVSETMVVRISGSQIVDLDVANVASRSCDSESPILGTSEPGPGPKSLIYRLNPARTPPEVVYFGVQNRPFEGS